MVPLQTGGLGPATLPLLLMAAGLVIAIAETAAPGAHFIVIGVGLLLAGMVGYVFPPASGPITLGALVVIFGLATLYAYREFDLYHGEDATTTDSASLRGATGRVIERVDETSGRVRLDDGGFDPNYAARSVEGAIAVDEQIIVVDPGGGNVVTVQPLSGGTDSIDRELRRERERQAAAAERADTAEDDGATEPEKE